MSLPPDTTSKPKPNRVLRWSFVLALLPALALTLGIPFVNRLEPESSTKSGVTMKSEDTIRA